jgi:glycerate dehydrogenase
MLHHLRPSADSDSRSCEGEAVPVRIVVLDGYTVNPGDNSWEEVARLGTLTVYDRTAPGEVVERLLGVDVALTNKTALVAAHLGRLPDLRFISVLATGYNVVDVAAARAANVPVANVPEYGTETVAQHVLALLLEWAHRVGAHDAAVRAGAWSRSNDFCFWLEPPIELAGSTFGVVGFGRIGQRVAALAHALGMSILVAGGSRRVDPGYRPFAWTTVPELFAQADVVSLHCPLTAENAAFVNAELIASMKPSALFINTARGGLVDEHALAAALDHGRLAGAAVDVVSAEPIHPDNPLLHARNCIITPHMAWGSLAARRRLVHQTARNIEAFLAGRPVNVVN